MSDRNAWKMKILPKLVVLSRGTFIIWGLYSSGVEEMSEVVTAVRALVKFPSYWRIASCPEDPRAHYVTEDVLAGDSARGIPFSLGGVSIFSVWTFLRTPRDSKQQEQPSTARITTKLFHLCSCNFNNLTWCTYWILFTIKYSFVLVHLLSPYALSPRRD